jgi:hypothetical protein
VVAAADDHEIRLMDGSGTGQLLREAAAADLGTELDTMFVGIRLGGAQPPAAGTLPALVLLADLAHAGAIDVRRAFCDGNRNQPGILSPGEANRLSQRPAG